MKKAHSSYSKLINFFHFHILKQPTTFEEKTLSLFFTVFTTFFNGSGTENDLVINKKEISYLWKCMHK